MEKLPKQLLDTPLQGGERNQRSFTALNIWPTAQSTCWAKPLLHCLCGTSLAPTWLKTQWTSLQPAVDDAGESWHAYKPISNAFRAKPMNVGYCRRQCKEPLVQTAICKPPRICVEVSDHNAQLAALANQVTLFKNPFDKNRSGSLPSDGCML